MKRRQQPGAHQVRFVMKGITAHCSLVARSNSDRKAADTMHCAPCLRWVHAAAEDSMSELCGELVERVSTWIPQPQPGHAIVRTM